MKKSDRKSDCGGERRKIEHPPLFCQSVSSVKHCGVCCLPRGVQGPFHLTWLCKRFSQRPKGGECQGLDKVPRLPDGPCRTEGGTGRERGVEVESSPEECLLNTGGRVVGVRGETQEGPGEGRCEGVCMSTSFPSKLECIQSTRNTRLTHSPLTVDVYAFFFGH